jgi:hypothetical protein
VVALVVSVICLAAVLLTQLLPMLMFGLIGFGVGGPFSDGDPFAAGSVGGFTGTVYDGSVTVNADGLVEAAALGAAVTSAMRGGEILGTVTCDPVPKAAADVTTLCRGDEFDMHSYAVIRFTSDTGRFQAMTFIYD